MSADEPNIINVFFSYANEDEKLKIELEKQLSFLKRQGLISGWNDRDIKAGQEWAYEIDKNLDIARIILLLISPDFIASDYCYSNEMTRAMERHEKGEALVIPIILRPVYWHDAPFSKLQALPTDGKPVKSWSDIDEALLDIAKGIRRIVVGILKEKWLKEGESSYKTRNFKAAFAAFEKAIELVPDCAEAYYGEGKVYFYRPYTEPETDVSDNELAIAAFNKAIELEPSYTNAYYQLGMVHQVEQEYQKALAAFDKAIELKPVFAQAYCQKGIIYRDRPLADEIEGEDDYELAVAAFNKAIELEPSYANAYYQLGIVLWYTPTNR